MTGRATRRAQAARAAAARAEAESKEPAELKAWRQRWKHPKYDPTPEVLDDMLRLVSVSLMCRRCRLRAGDVIALGPPGSFEVRARPRVNVAAGQTGTIELQCRCDTPMVVYVSRIRAAIAECAANDGKLVVVRV